MTNDATRTIKPESRGMSVASKIGFNRIAWALRRLYCPVARDALVLEVGSGGNPYARSNVLLDAYEETRERHWVPLVVDRPFVFGFVENLPFKSHTFDFLIASHVLEHSRDPEQTLMEFQRVAKAGYIEVPDAFMERINPYKDHRLEIALRDNKLIIRKKQNWILDNDLVELYEHRVKKLLTKETMRKHPSEFHVRYYWQEKISYEILNPGIDTEWEPPISVSNQVNVGNHSKRIRQWIIDRIRNSLSQGARNQSINLFELLRCPVCLSETDLQVHTSSLSCGHCGAQYAIRNGIPVMG